MAQAYWGNSRGGLLNNGQYPTQMGGNETAQQMQQNNAAIFGAQPQTQFSRFNFGGSAYPNPYVAQQSRPGQSQPAASGAASGLLGGAIGQLQAGNVAGVFGAGAVPGVGTPPAAEGFGPGAAPAGAGQSWQDFQFQNPESDFQKNYNYLKGVDPELARAYGFSPFHANEFKTALDPTNSGTGSALLNSYYGGGSAGQTGTMQSLGLAPDWRAKYDPQWVGSMFSGDGKTITAGGKTYTLPAADKSYMPASGASSWSAQSPMDFSQFGLAPTR